MTQTAIFQKRNELKPSLQKEFAVKEIGVFGSFSDNTFHQDSDIDILVEFEKPIGWRFFTFGNVFGKKHLAGKQTWSPNLLLKNNSKSKF